MQGHIPMLVRQNLRDSEGSKEKLIQQLNAIGSGNWQFEADIGAICQALKEANAERQIDIGSLLYDSDGYFGYVVADLTTLCQNPALKKAFLEMCPTKTLRFIVSAQCVLPKESEAQYSETEFKDGVLVAFTKPQYWTINIYRTGGYLSRQLALGNATTNKSGGGLPPGVLSDLAANEPAKQRLLARLKKCTGVDWKFDVDHESIWRQIRAASTCGDNFQQDLGWGLYDDKQGPGYFGDLVGRIEEICQDPIGKDGILQGIPTHTIGIEIVKETTKEWWYADRIIRDGKLIVLFLADKWKTNIGDGVSLAELL